MWTGVRVIVEWARDRGGAHHDLSEVADEEPTGIARAVGATAWAFVVSASSPLMALAGERQGLGSSKIVPTPGRCRGCFIASTILLKLLLHPLCLVVDIEGARHCAARGR